MSTTDHDRRNIEFTNSLTTDNLTRELLNAAKRLESAARELRAFADQVKALSPDEFTESVVHIVPSNVAHLAQSVLMDMGSASRDLISAQHHSGQYRAITDQEGE